MANNSLRTVLGYLRRVTGLPEADQTSDVHLLERFVERREEAAFEAIVERHGPLVLGVCRRMLADLNDVDDAFQATFVILSRKAGSIRKAQSLASWLYGVAYRVAVRAKRRAATRRAHERKVQDMPQADPLADVVWRDLKPVLDEELHRLPEKYRAPLVLCYLEGKTNEEAARSLGWPAGSMSRRLDKARQLLRAALLRRGITLPAAGLAGLFSCQELSAAVPAALVRSAVQAALTGAATHAASAGLSASVAELVEGVLRDMFLNKFKWAAALVLAVGLAGTAIALLAPDKGAPVPATAEKDRPIALPKDPKAPVIVLDYMGGGIRRQSDEPILEIRADGTLLLGNPFGTGKKAETKLSPQEVQDLLRYILRSNDFLNITEGKITAAIQANDKGPFVAVTGASILIVRVHADGKEHQVKYYAAGTMAGLHPKVKELAQLVAIEKRLDQVCKVVTAGGKEAVAAALKLANERLHKDYPKAPVLTDEDLSQAIARQDTLVLTFLRQRISADKDPATYVRVTIEKPAKGETKVTVAAKLK
jgi:RNA polymerase sigma factor (sigma-70 family)